MESLRYLSFFTWEYSRKTACKRKGNLVKGGDLDVVIIKSIQNIDCRSVALGLEKFG